MHTTLAGKPRLRRFIRRSAKLVWWTISLQLFTRLRGIGPRRSAVPAQPTEIPAGGGAGERPPPASPAPPPVTLRVRRMARAGNEYRIQRVLSWLDANGWDVAFLYCPLSGEEPDEKQLSALRTGCENVIYVHRSGDIRYSVARPDLDAVVAALDGRMTRDVAGQLQEASQPASRLLGVMRTFSADALIEVMCAIDAALAPGVVLATYVFMTRGLPLLRGGTLKIVDTIDLFSTKSAKVTPYGIEDGLAMSEAEEAQLLSRADLVLAIQPDEAAELRRIVPATAVLTVGVDMQVDTAPAALVEAPVVLLVASGNSMNAKGLRDFLRFAWPRVLQAVPGAKLYVVGSVGSAVPGDEPGVVRLGLVDDLAEAYRAARVVINPAVAGTGIKIKTLEALANLRPLVTWPSGLDGVAPDLRALCVCVTDWSLIRLLTDDEAAQQVIASRVKIVNLLSPAVAFAELEAKLARVPEPAE